MEKIFDQEINDLITSIKDKIKNLKEYNIDQKIIMNQRLQEIKESIKTIKENIDLI